MKERSLHKILVALSAEVIAEKRVRASLFPRSKSFTGSYLASFPNRRQRSARVRKRSLSADENVLPVSKIWRRRKKLSTRRSDASKTSRTLEAENSGTPNENRRELSELLREKRGLRPKRYVDQTVSSERYERH